MNLTISSRIACLAGTSLALAACLVTMAAAAEASPAGQPVAPPAGTSTQQQPTLDTAAIAPGAAAAFAASEKISVPAATARLAEEQVLAGVNDQVERTLGARTGGSYLDDAGQLVVTTVDATGDAAVTKAGARPQRVRATTADLDAVVNRLDAMASSPAGSGSVQGWYVDVVHNDVVVTATAGANDSRSTALLTVARSFGRTVRVETAPASQAPRPTDYLVGGYQFVLPSGGTCSVGFNMLDSANRNVVLTAGHCTKQAGNSTRNGYIIGANRSSNFPGTDFGSFYNSYPSYWQPSPSVYTWQYGTYVTVKGYVAAPLIGSQVCKSGRTTGWTCGTILAGNQSVTYPEGVVRGLVRHNACVQGGDSGGSNISPSGYALGVTSGASMTTGGLCLGGTSSISWYQPIAPAMTATGLRLRIG